MFPEMRRKKQLLSRAESDAILYEGTSGVLALWDGEYPYAVPLSYVYNGEKLYFHCAKAGHKIDAIRSHPKASFCVTGQDQVVPEEYTTYYRSVIVFGQVRELEDENEKRAAAQRLAARYAPENSPERHQEIIRREWKNLCLLEMSVDSLTGKKAIELVQAEQSAG